MEFQGSAVCVGNLFAGRGAIETGSVVVVEQHPAGGNAGEADRVQHAPRILTAEVMGKITGIELQGVAVVHAVENGSRGNGHGRHRHGWRQRRRG
mgnify:CR=1 FL=1